MTQEQKEKQEINKAWLGVFAILGEFLKKHIEKKQ